MAGNTSTLQDFLEQEWPEWKDDDFARAHFKAFTGQKQDWEERMNFWKDAILKVTRHLNLLIIDTEDVQQKWFLRDGFVPLGLKHVLVEMNNSGELETVDQFLGTPRSAVEMITTLLRQALTWAGLGAQSDQYSETEPHLEGRLVVRSALQERAALFIKSVRENHLSPVCIMTSARIKELCGGAENAELIIGYLLLQKKAVFVTLDGDDNVEGFKLSLNDKQVSAVSENDRHLLQLQWTLEMLQIRLNTVESKIAATKTELIRVAKAGDRRDALRRLRNMKLLQASRDQCAGFMDKIEQVLGVIADAETSKKVSDAIRVGTAAIKDNHVSIEDVHSCLDELDEAITVQRETEDALGAQISGTEEDNTLFEEELAALEKELSVEEEIANLPEVPKTEVIHKPPVENAEPEDVEEDAELEKEFAKLALELA
ncbi:hypothetical protein R1sor_005360 [Riccia sorocarpa]|uniref:Charged multivesicular body protein 7 n=1 Tax=Riccia sorocarpa TaxID=122646 RepID=A0ABD3HMW0_9MARC